MKAALSAQINKMDRNDARGIAPACFAPSTSDRAEPKDQDVADGAQIPAVEDYRYQEQPARHLRNFCLKVGTVTRAQFEARVIDLIKERPHRAMTIAPLLEVRRVLGEQYQCLHKSMERLAADDSICRLLMTAPGVGPLVSLTFSAGMDEVARFSRSRSVPAQFGLTPARYQSGEMNRGRGIFKCGTLRLDWP